MMSLTTVSISSDFSFVNGRGMSSNSTTILLLYVTTNAPFLGLSLLISITIPFALLSHFNPFSMLAARVLNAPQDLHASIVTTFDDDEEDIDIDESALPLDLTSSLLTLLNAFFVELAAAFTIFSKV